MQASVKSDLLRIEFDGCCESLDLLENDVELEKVVAWILMMNRLCATFGRGHPTIESDPADASLRVEIAIGESAIDEKNVRYAVFDLLGVFDPVEHRVLRVHSDVENKQRNVPERASAPLALWRGRQPGHQSSASR